MVSSQYFLRRQRSRHWHCIVLVLSFISPNARIIRPVSSFQLKVHTINKAITDITQGVKPTSATGIMAPSRSRKSSALSAKSGSDSNSNDAQTQFVTNKRCPFAQKAWIALEASECPYQMREVSLYGAGGKPDWFWELNPQGTVPIVAVKNDGGGAKDVFADSELILDAVGDGRVGGREGLLLTSELSEEENARIAQWRKAISKQLVPVGKSAVLGGSLPKLRSLLSELNGMVVGPYLAGEKITVADCAAFPFLWRIDQEYGIGGATENEENLRAWLDTCMGTPSIKRTIPVQGWWWWW